MSKRIDSQRRGKGGPAFRARKRGKESRYISIEESKGKLLRGQVVDLLKEPGRNTIIAKISLGEGKEFFTIAPEGLFIGSEIEMGEKAGIETGNILPLKSIPEGCPVFNIELKPGDGGAIARSTGIFALVVSKDSENALIKLPSGKTKSLPIESRATVGCASGGERKEKPFVKAGKKLMQMKAKGGRLFPVTRGVAKNASSHPFGGEQHHAGKSKSVSRHAPPGRKVGQIASKRTGRKKR